MWGRSGNGILDIYPTGSAVYSILNLHNTAGGTAYNAQLIATSGQSVYLGSGNTGDVVLRTGNTQNKVVGKHNGATELYHSSNKKFETTSSGATITGNLAFPSGNGIDFSATADGSGSGQYELLDDYEEGNWTPTVENGSGAFYVYSAKYTKIGRQVGIQFYMQLNNGAGNGNGVSIGGLPFAVRSNGWTCAKVSTGYNNSGVHCRAKAGTSAIDIKGPADQSVTFSNINGTWILSSFVYFTDS